MVHIQRGKHCEKHAVCNPRQVTQVVASKASAHRRKDKIPTHDKEFKTGSARAACRHSGDGEELIGRTLARLEALAHIVLQLVLIRARVRVQQLTCSQVLTSHSLLLRDNEMPRNCVALAGP